MKLLILTLSFLFSSYNYSQTTDNFDYFELKHCIEDTKYEYYYELMDASEYCFQQQFSNSNIKIKQFAFSGYFKTTNDDGSFNNDLPMPFLKANIKNTIELLKREEFRKLAREVNLDALFLNMNLESDCKNNSKNYLLMDRELDGKRTLLILCPYFDHIDDVDKVIDQMKNKFFDNSVLKN